MQRFMSFMVLGLAACGSDSKPGVSAAAAQDSQGKGWVLLDCVNNLALTGVSFRDANTGWAVGTKGEVIRTKDGGKTCDTTRVGITGPLHGVFAGAKKTWIVGPSAKAEGASIYCSKDSGDTFDVAFNTYREIPNREFPEADSLQSICFADATRGWAAGGLGMKQGVILATKDGEKWAVAFNAPEKRPLRFNDISSAGADIVVAVGSGGAIVATFDGGKTWDAQKSGTDQELNRVRCWDEKNWIAISAASTMLATVDAGKTWKKSQVTKAPETLFALCIVGDHVWIGARGKVLRSDDRGATWREQPIARQAPVTSIVMLDEKNGYASCGHFSVRIGGWFKTDSGGD